jgi:hypothetical protein
MIAIDSLAVGEEGAKQMHADVRTKKPRQKRTHIND